MKQVFQARLSQVEKKYHQQLSLQGPHPQNSSVRGNIAATPLYQNVFAQRVSWHGDLNTPQEDSDVKSPTQADSKNVEDVLPDTAKKLIEQKLEEYKKEMMDMFMEKTKSMEKQQPSHSLPQRMESFV